MDNKEPTLTEEQVEKVAKFLENLAEFFRSTYKTDKLPATATELLAVFSVTVTPLAWALKVRCETAAKADPKDTYELVACHMAWERMFALQNELNMFVSELIINKDIF
jgi:hypothetical protein